MTQELFDDKTRPPDDAALTDALGPTKKLWDALIGHVTREYEPVVQTWGFYRGWSLRLVRRKRTILYLIPRRKHFQCASVFGGKATNQARQASLPPAVLATINDARVYAEGRGFRLDVRKKPDLVVAEKLATIKMAN